MKPLQKGSYTYYQEKKKRQTFQTIVFLAIPLALFFGGWMTTGTQKNLLTFVAILGTLPACKSAAVMIMYYVYHGCNQSFYETVNPNIEGLCHLYGMVFTTPEHGTYEVPSIVVKNNSICGFLCGGKQSDKKNAAKLEEHITAIMRQNGYSNVVVKMFEKEDTYLNRIAQMRQTETENEKRDLEQQSLLCDISL